MAQLGLIYLGKENDAVFVHEMILDREGQGLWTGYIRADDGRVAFIEFTHFGTWGENKVRISDRERVESLWETLRREAAN